MRIALSGSAGTGKSTLARALARRLEYPLVDEGYEAFYDASGRLVQPLENLIARVHQVLDLKRRQVQAASNSVSDRCPIDLFNLWLSWGLARRQGETRRLYERCRADMKDYGRVVLMPWGALPLTQLTVEEGNRRRNLNPWVQFHNHSTIIGLARQWVRPKKIVPLPGTLDTLDARVEFVLERLVGRP